MRTAFLHIDRLLLAHQRYWRFEPFHESGSKDHRFTNTELGDWLESLSMQQVQQCKQNVQTLTSTLTTFLPSLADLAQHSCLKQTQVPPVTLNSRLTTGVPGRKLTQITAMGAQVLHQHCGTQWLEWCAGKGFLGRILADQSQQAVRSFEWQSELCEKGQAEANKQQLPVTFIEGDAFNCDHKAVFNHQQHAVALHACGDLHVALMHHAMNYQLPALSIAPCCYHLIQGEHYQAQSDEGKASSLILSKSELRIPLQETVTGGERVQRHRLLEMSFRLGLDELLRGELGLQQYQPIPSIKKSQLQLGFREFCLWAAQRKGLTLPECDFEQYRLQGELRFARMEKLSLVQMAFHRALEMWLVLDKSLFLAKHGYQITLNEFCSKAITPRNILIHAKRTEPRCDTNCTK
ncbi:SAM-dependent methyltransferase [Vibrio rarus]|uniref:SAM-dependent methyltransferase n=1 Tax=Vibrio rarus TaxID=413403 RepID=UPI0021C40C1F|nr:SAM-dependent methyltransferase [Vibrio rarus]